MREQSFMKSFTAFNREVDSKSEPVKELLEMINGRNTENLMARERH